MNVWRVIGLGLIGLTVSFGLSAQTLSRAPSPEEACMTPGPAERGMPEYPKAALAHRDSATVDTELTFAAADAEPTIKYLGDIRRDDFFDAIRSYVKRFRVPCMAKGSSPVRIQLTFDFVPNDGQKVSFFLDDTRETATRRRELMRCMQQPGKGAVRYPSSLLRYDQQGVVIATLVFDRPDAPPTLNILHDGGSGAFAKAVEPYAAQMRLPCLPEGQSFDMQLSWIFTVEGAPRGWIKDLDLMTFLSAVKGIDQQKVFFDFNTMSCPFTLSFSLRQPYALNAVGQVGEPQPSRIQFTRWLERLDLNIPARHRELVMAHQSQIRVPCGQLDL